MILNTSTDDFLCAFNDQSLFDRLCTNMRTMFDITTKEGEKFQYLNLDIIQYKHYFPPDKIADSKLKQVHTPYSLSHR